MNGHGSTAYDPPSSFGGPGDAADDPRVIEVVEDYLRELEAGGAPDRQVFLARYPELAGAIGECLDGLEIVRQGVASRPGKPAALPRHRSIVPLESKQTAAPLGDFQIVRELARGGMGVIYEAVQLSLGRPVALKVLPFAATVDSRQLQRFKIEAQAAALLHHPHIVPIYAVGCERGVHFYAMQLIDGQSLAVVIQQLREKAGRPAPGMGPSNVFYKGPTADVSDDRVPLVVDEKLAEPAGEPTAAAQAPRSTVDFSATMTSGSSVTSDGYIRRVARLIVQAAGALEHAHQAGVVHRDIKPANLLLDASGNLWITDFGLAQLHADNGLTRSGDLLGTFRYMSPEQTGGQRTMLDHRTDVYSLGATFYELLALEPAYTGETHQELLYKILHAEPRSLRELNRAIPAELETIILKCLNKNPVDRYRTAAEFGADVQRYLDHQPILARRPSLVDRARKWSRRHPAIVVAGVLILVVVAVALLISNALISNQQRQTADALAREKLRAGEAEARFQQARQAVDVLFQISEEELADKPAEGARRRILQTVLNFYEDFIEQRKGDPASQADLAREQEKVKGILSELRLLQREMQTRLLFNEAVQRDLQLSSKDESRLKELLAKWSDQYREFFEEIRNLREEDRRARIVALAKEHEHSLSEVLQPAQLARFKQIGIQAQGLMAFKEPEIVAELELTPGQRAQIRDIEREMFAKRFERGGPGSGPPGGPPQGPPGEPGRPDRGPPPGVPGGPPPGFDREEALAKVLGLFNEQQVKSWRELTGAPFTGFGREGFPGGPFGPPRP